MARDDWKELAAWEGTQVRDEDGSVAICFGLAATLYFHDGHSEEKRRMALACFEEYEVLCGSMLKWFATDSNRMSSVAKLRSRDMSPYLLSAKWNRPDAREHAWAFLWHGGELPDDASPFKIEVYGSPKMYAELDNSLSFLQVSFPVLWFQDKPEEFPELILSWCNRLRPHHGYGGVTLLESPDSGLAQNYSPEIAGFAARYFGLEIDRPMSHKLATQEGVKGGNWLTILSNYFVDMLGGRESLTQALGESFFVKDYNGGLIMVAGPVPEVGDQNRNVDTPRLKHLAKVLKPVRIEEHPIPYSNGRFSEDGEFAGWLARFDE